MLGACGRFESIIKGSEEFLMEDVLRAMMKIKGIKYFEEAHSIALSEYMELDFAKEKNRNKRR